MTHASNPRPWYTRILVLHAVLPILFGAAFTVAVATAMGSLLLRALRLPFALGETALMSFVSGSACLSLATFLLCLIHQARWPVLLWGGLTLILWALRQVRPDRSPAHSRFGEPESRPLTRDSQSSSSFSTTTQPPKTLARTGSASEASASYPQPPTPNPQPPFPWLAPLCFLLLAAFFLAYFFNALAPEVSPDGSGYHLGNVARLWRHHGFVWDYHSMYSYLSQGAEMLFLVAFTFGGHSAAALVHFAFLTTLPLLMISYGRRFGLPRAALFAAILAYTCPIAGLAGVSAYNDLAVATVLFAVFYLLQVWDESKDTNLLILIGLLSGFSYALKYTACLALPFALTFVYARTRDRRALIVPLAAAVMIAPWVLRNWIWLGNPFAPFLNRWFPNPWFHPGPEHSYLADLGRYEGINHFWEIPLQLTLHGRLIQGMVGPVFLLAPFALLALRHPHGRRLLLAALVFAVPGYFNTGARFLIPAIPFLSLAMGIALANSWGVLPALAIFEALVCWPTVLALYSDPIAWQIRAIPVRAAFRQDPESEFLDRHLHDYALKEPIERAVAPNEKIFSFSTRAEAYIDRDIVVSYESALGNLAEDILYTPLYHPPIVRRRIGFESQNARGVRIFQTASADAYWTVSEVRLLSRGTGISRPVTGPACVSCEGWRFTAQPNRWEAGLAFDGSPVTRWSTWQPMSPDSRLQVEFGRAEPLDEVILEGPVDAAHVSVEVWSNGLWKPVDGPMQETRIEPPPDLRRAATRQLTGRGIRYLLIDNSDFIAADLHQRAAQWGITKLAEAHGISFYRID